MLTIVMVALMGVSFVSCGNDAVVPPVNPLTPVTPVTPGATSIVGTWRDIDVEGFDIYTFNANGTGTIQEFETELGVPVLCDVTNFTYTFDSTTMILTITHEWGLKETFTVESLTATKMVIVEGSDRVELVR